MNIINWILVGSFIIFVISGWKQGLISEAGSVLGVFVGLFLASRLYAWAGELISGIVINENAANVLGFLLVLLVVSKGFGVVVWFLNKAFQVLSIIPGMAFVNQLGGAVFGAIEGMLILGLAVNFAHFLPLTEQGARNLNDSWAAGLFDALTNWLVPLFPAALETLKNVVAG